MVWNLEYYACVTVMCPVLSALPLFTSRYPPCNIFLSKTHRLTYSLIKKAVTYYWNTYYRRTVGLDYRCILIRRDKVVFGWAVCLAAVRFSLRLMWTTSILFCVYLQCIIVCAGDFSMKTSGENCTQT